MSKLLTQLDELIASTRRRIEVEVHLPLIADVELQVEEILKYAWHYDEAPLLDALKHVTSDVDDLAARFVALNILYRLMEFDDSWEDGESRSPKRLKFRRQLVQFIKKRNASDASALPDVRFEIANACSVGEFARAISYFESLKTFKTLSSSEMKYFFGRLHWMCGFRSGAHPVAWDIPMGSPNTRPNPNVLAQWYECWDLRH